MSTSRRDFLRLGLGAAAAAAIGARLTMAAEGKKIPLALQLYSVRKDCQQDLPPVLAAVAKMGYEAVEFAGYYGRQAPELRKLLDDNGLKCCGTHTGLNTLMDDAFKATVEFNQTLGNPFLIVPGLPKKNVESVAALKDTGKLFSDLAAKACQQKMRVGYHAHGGDFKLVEGQVPWYVLFDNATPEVVMQMDMGNCIGGGGDPYEALKKYPGRATTVHLKEHGGEKTAVVGEGEVKWDEVFKLCESIGGTQWYIVEHERNPATALADVGRCIENLRKMGK